MMEDLLRKPMAHDGLIHAITPENAGWRYVGFELYRLALGAAATGLTKDCEAILVMVEGHAQVQAAGQDWGVLGDRMDVFEKTAPHCLYIPPGQSWEAKATTDCSVAICFAPATGNYPPQRLGPDGITLMQRGKGSNARWINNIAMEEADVAERLLVTEVFTPSGNWSSYPSHRHDEDDYPRITYLEESYYHRLNPPQGFGVQRVYTDDGDLDETMAVKNHDVVLVPRGHHPCAAPHGYEMYYLNVMAGPLRKWRFIADPHHAWLM